MKISQNWLNEYLPLDISTDDLSALLTDIGLEVGGVDHIGGNEEVLSQLVVGHVTSVEKHPDADRLSVTQVDLGNGTPVQIVCGAPNVAEGQKVVVAPVGTTLQPAGGDPFKIKKAKIRGQESEGMICAEDEIGVGTDHDGIMVLSNDAAPGSKVTDHINIDPDVVFDIDLTPNRSDAMSHLGVARDVAAALAYREGSKATVTPPSTANFKVDSNDLVIDVEIEDTEACPRYAGLTLSGITVAESPTWLKSKIASIGQRPINNIVDITNFILHEYGQPLHAFDADKITGNKIVVKKLEKGTRFVTLDDEERKLNDYDLMICNSEGGMCIAGVFGGAESGVTDGTTKIFLESAYFEPGHIRRTSTSHGLKSDAALRFEKGADPNICIEALKRAAMLMAELGGGTISSDIVDHYPEPIENATVQVESSYIDTIIGEKVPEADMQRIMELLGMEVSTSGGKFTVSVPPFKADVLRPADVAEEILRIYGYNAVAIPSTLRSSISYGERPNKDRILNKVSDILTGSGYHEMMGTSISDSKYYEKHFPAEDLVPLKNFSSEGMDTMRRTMFFSAMEAVRHNLNRQQENFKAFEFGNTYSGGKQYDQEAHLTLVATGSRRGETWDQKTAPVGFFYLKGMVNKVLQLMGVSGDPKPEVPQFLAEGLTVSNSHGVLAEFGKVDSKLLGQLDIKKDVFFADLHWDNILASAAENGIKYEPISKFPSVRRDLALVVDEGVTFADMEKIAWETEKKLLQGVNLFDVYADSKLGEGKKSYAVSFVFQDENDTLTDARVEQVIDQLVSKYEKQLNANIRK